MSVAESESPARQGIAHAKPPRFNRPELDLLRFFAFLGVFVHHAPALPFRGGDLIKRTGALGLSIFFLLSAYLITELLLRERSATGTISWKLFFIRRALRIWPLYYIAIFAAYVFGAIRLPDTTYYMPPAGLGSLSLFIANWVIPAVSTGILIGPLWSISIEEQFYLVWAPIAKLGGRRAIVTVSALMLVTGAIRIWIRQSHGWTLWFDTFVEFIFFAGGALIAILLSGKESPVKRTITRVAFAVLALAVLAITARVSGIGTSNVPAVSRMTLLAGYFGALVGCSLLFVSVLGLKNVPRGLAYLGKISYGLYVFHSAWIILFERFIVVRLRIPDEFSSMAVLAGAFLCTVATAHLSYQLYEKKFLLLKERFEVVRSRPV